MPITLLFWISIKKENLIGVPYVRRFDFVELVQNFYPRVNCNTDDNITVVFPVVGHLTFVQNLRNRNIECLGSYFLPSKKIRQGLQILN